MESARKSLLDGAATRSDGIDTMTTALEPKRRTIYEDRIVTAFTASSILWALLGMAAGVYAAAELVWPVLNFDLPWLTFGRLRTGHTNLVLFGFGVSAL